MRKGNLLLSSFSLSSHLGLQIYCHQLGLAELLDRIEDSAWSKQEWNQGFVCSSNLIVFIPRDQIGCYWIEIYQSNSFIIDPASYFAFVIPFHLKESGFITFCGDDLREGHDIQMEAGHYHLVFQECSMTQNEVDGLPVDMSINMLEDLSEYTDAPHLAPGPKRLIFTFIPTSQPCKPEILQIISGHRIQEPISLRSEFSDT
jgi:hypothetical protein